MGSDETRITKCQLDEANTNTCHSHLRSLKSINCCVLSVVSVMKSKKARFLLEYILPKALICLKHEKRGKSNYQVNHGMVSRWYTKRHENYLYSYCQFHPFVSNDVKTLSQIRTFKIRSKAKVFILLLRGQEFLQGSFSTSIVKSRVHRVFKLAVDFLKMSNFSLLLVILCLIGYQHIFLLQHQI